MGSKKFFTFVEWFKTLRPKVQKDICTELEEIFSITCDPGLELRIQSLEYTIKEKNSEIKKLKKTLKLMSKEPIQDNTSINRFYDAIPKEERQNFKRQIVGAWLYRNLILENKNLRARNKILSQNNNDLIYQLLHK